MIQKFVFYNHFNNGDIHVSREFVRQILSKITKPEILFFYSHKNDSSIIQDIPDLSYKEGLLQELNHYQHSSKTDTTIYSNTWYGAKNQEYLNRWGISFDCLYFSFDDFCKAHLNFSLQDLSSDLKVFFPSINYIEYQIKEIDSWLQYNLTKKKIFISNGPVLSGQAVNFQFAPILNRLAKNHKDKIFLYTSKDPAIIPTENVICSSDIIKKIGGSDLNENGYLSTFCDTIIGRASGPFSFAFNRDNLFDKQKKFISFDNSNYKPNKFWLSDHFRDKIDYSAEIITSNVSNTENVFSLIERNIS